MFDKIFDLFSTAITTFVIICIVMLILVFIKKAKRKIEHAEKVQREEDEKRNLINTIIDQSRELPMDVLIDQINEVHRAYDVLLECKRSGSIKSKEWVWIKVGDRFGVGMDLSTCSTILKILNNEINRRR